MDLSSITVMIITFNEEPNIERCLQTLSWAGGILLIDSGSTDKTVEIARRFPQVRVLHRPFDHFASQCNFGLKHIDTPWVLSLDADYIVDSQFAIELSELSPDAQAAGYLAAFRYCIGGRALRGSLYPPRVVLYRRAQAHYLADGHCHRVKINGLIDPLRTPISHDDRKPLSRWFSSQDSYAQLEAAKLLSMSPSDLHFQDRIRRTMVLGPPLVLVYTLLVKGAILDGWPGWFYTLQRTVAEMMLSLRLMERRLEKLK